LGKVERKEVGVEERKGRGNIEGKRLV